MTEKTGENEQCDEKEHPQWVTQIAKLLQLLLSAGLRCTSFIGLLHNLLPKLASKTFPLQCCSIHLPKTNTDIRFKQVSHVAQMGKTYTIL